MSRLPFLLQDLAQGIAASCVAPAVPIMLVLDDGDYADVERDLRSHFGDQTVIGDPRATPKPLTVAGVTILRRSDVERSGRLGTGQANGRLPQAQSPA